MSAVLRYVDLEQGSSEWLEYRKNKIGSSDARVIMGECPWSTPYKLWLEKLSLAESKKANAQMQRGIKLEDQARLSFFLETGIQMTPKVILHPEYEWMMASLDGIDESGRYALELKCPGYEDHLKALNGKIPEKYYSQPQHSYECGKGSIEKVFYYSFDGEKGVILEPTRDNDYIQEMLIKEKDFYKCMTEVIPPAMNDKDYDDRKDDLFLQAAEEWKVIYDKLKEYEGLEDESRQHLIALAQNRSCLGGGIRMTKSIRKGNVDYSAIPELKGVNLDMYRKKSSEFWRFSKT